ncbi:hypothetical protein Mgra_00009644 [Meloidogyne graminicola]|uniref:Uncharacterized protein n=1 Tax=Meloidogyne graminicola TaxID=189291 RepID=A0A8S9Z7A3_9BILA|nr:hypothetical protein Mgra_00009644 [Meloidogyne graminicola]
MMAFDESELVVNEIYDLFTNKVKIFSLIQNNPANIQTLQLEEDKFLNYFPVLFEHDDSYENEYYIFLNNYSQLIHFSPKSRTNIIPARHFPYFEPFLIRPNTYNLYKLFFSEHVSNDNNLQQILQEHYINQQNIILI